MTHKEIAGLFQEYNGKYFGGTLPEITIKMSSRRTSRSLGKYYCAIRRDLLTGEQTILRRFIMIYPLAMLNNVRETLFHEMTHYYLHHRGLPYGHNRLFKTIMARWNADQARSQSKPTLSLPLTPGA